MSQSVRVFLFGDQTYDFVPKLRELLDSRHDPILTAFLDQSHYVIRAQAGQFLPRDEAKASATPNLAQLLHKYCERKLNPAFQTALSCITQLGWFMSQHGEIGKPYPRPENTYLLGLCTGALAAAAVSSCNTLSELLPAAVQTVQVSFRLGLCVVDIRDRIEPPDTSTAQEWSMFVAGLEPKAAETVIKNFCEQATLPRTSQPWIGATASKGTTISGPPSTLKRMREIPSVAKCKIKTIPIFVPAHTSHLFTKEDVGTILETTFADAWQHYTPKIPLISSATGKLAWIGNFRGLLEQALSECLLDSVRFDRVTEELPRLISSRDVESVILTPIATTAEQSLISTLKFTIPVILDEQKKTATNQTHCTPAGKAKLAIVGMSGRFPESKSPEAFWDLLYKGLDVCKEVPPIRWNIETHVDPTGKAHNRGATPWGCWLDFAGEFDPRFFSISPKEAPQMDPAQRMALMTTYEAMEQAGIVTDNTPSTHQDRIGVFQGVTSTDYMITNTSQDIDTYFITGGNRGFIPGRINFCFEFAGPSYTNDTACSSSLAAIHLACNSLWRGDCDTAVAGGSNMVTSPDGHAGLDKGFFLSRTGNCKTFDDNADGYCRAEGVGNIFIKRMEDALADNDPILAVILDTKTNHSAMAESISRPHVGAQIDNMSAVLSNAVVDPNTLDYIEMHGTGTQVGDAVEMESVLNVFAPEEGSRGPDQPLWVGSAKANIGHGEGASGVTSIAKVLLMMKHNVIPPHCGIKPGSKINHNYPDLAARNVHIAFEPKLWPRKERPRRVLVNNFSAAGGNTAILLEDPPIIPISNDTDLRTSHIINISAHVPNSLRRNLQSLLDFIEREESNGISLSQLSYTTTARRVHYLHRVSVTGSTISEIKSALKAAIAAGDGMTRAKMKPKVLFAFTGQGSQYLEMGKQLFNAFPRFQSDLQRYDQLAQSLGIHSFLHVITSSEGNIDEFTPIVVQLAICCLEIAVARLLISFGLKPDAVVGHSLGEYAALHIAGVLSVSDTIYLVGKRAQLLQERCTRGTHAMLAVKASRSTVETLLSGKKYEIACVNGPEDTVLSGSNSEITTIKGIISNGGLKSTLLKVPFAFHSTQVNPILETFEFAASGVTFHTPQIPVLCPLHSDVVKDVGTFSSSYLAQHCRGTVDIRGALQYAKDHGLLNERSLTIEVGPQPTVCGMVKATLDSNMVTLPLLQRNKDVWANMTSTLSTTYTNGLTINWLEYHRAFKSCHKVLDLPAYGWDLKDYWIPYNGDWCLHRHHTGCNCEKNGGHAQVTKQDSLIKNPPAPPKQEQENPAAPMPSLISTTIHKLIEERIETLGASIIVETDVSDPDFHNIAQGHFVNNIPLCTPSVYSDIGFTLGNYLVHRLRPGYKGIIDVADLVIEKALIPHGKGPQLLRTSIKVKWAAKSAGATKSAQCLFYSVDFNGKTTSKHGWCTIRFIDEASSKFSKEIASDYLARIKRLRDGIKTGQFVRYNGISGYKLIRQLAQFHPDFKLIDEVILDESRLEACSTMNFDKIKTKGFYAAHPAYVDAITQVAGFAMNAKDSTDLEKEIFVNHGWDSLQIYEDLKPGRHYETYVQMKHHKEDLYHGDTVMFDGDRVVAFFKGLSLRNLPRKTLNMVLQQIVTSQDRANNAISLKGIQRSAPSARTPPPFMQKPMSATVSSVPSIQEKSIEAESLIGKKVSISSSSPSESSSIGQARGKIQAALEIVSEESGIAVKDLTDDSNFADIGVDSLLSMVIGSRFREELGLDLEADFSIFVDLPTVKHLKEFFGEASEAAPNLDLDEEPSQEFSPPSAKLTDLHEQSTVEVLSQTNPIPERGIGSGISGIDLKSTASPAASEQVMAALQIVSEESGIAVSDLTDDSNFADIGVDSLLSMVIGSRFREELGLDLDTDWTIFVDAPTVKDLKIFLAGSSDVPSDSSMSSYAEVSSAEISSHDESPGDSEIEMPTIQLYPHCRPCTSVILQGIPKTAKQTLFLLPDGSGSSSSYLGIPRVRGDIALVGLNCPYARDPENMNCTHFALMDSYCNEIRRRQPKGPYNLGGWSSGGAFAYACAETLVNQGEEVHSLIIIDSPVPQVMDRLPTSFYEYCNSVGMFAGGQASTAGSVPPAPAHLIPHFAITVEVMMPYTCKPLKSKRMPRVGIIWACETVMDEKVAPKLKGMHFMVNKRKDFGPDGWEKILPGAEFVIEKCEGGNHFSMMQKKHIHKVRDLIERVMA